MKTTLFTLFLFASLISFAQDNNSPTQTSSVIVHKDPRVDLLVKKQASINTVTKKANQRSMRGYRLLIINTNKREEAIDAKTKVYTYFPELKSYLAYQTPYFKLKAGNFKTRDEAEKYRKLMSTLFPKGVFIINDIIEIKYDKEELEELE